MTDFAAIKTQLDAMWGELHATTIGYTRLSPSSTQGHWRNAEQIYQNKVLPLLVDSPPTPPPTPTPTDPPYLREDFEQGIGPFKIAVGSNNYAPLDPKFVRLVDNNLGGKAVALNATQGSSFTDNSAEMVALWLDKAEQAHAGWDGTKTVDGQHTVYRVRVRYPYPLFVPTTGEWNWVCCGWHNDQHTASYGSYSIDQGIYTDYPVVQGGVGKNPRVVLRVGGGSSAKPVYTKYEAGALKYDHWYDCVYDVVWSTDETKGRFDWFVDGTQYAAHRGSTLMRNPDGTQQYNNFGLYNYRLHDPVHSSEVQFDFVALGPTKASVS